MNEQEQELLDKIYSFANKIGQWDIIWDDLNMADFIYGCYFDEATRTYNVYRNEERGVHIICLTTPDRMGALKELYGLVSSEASIIRYVAEQDAMDADMLKSIDLYTKMQKNVLGGIKVPHKTSLPVIRKENDQYYLAVFIYFFTRTEIQTNQFRRPSVWDLADIETGEIIHEYECKDRDFSDAPYDTRYYIWNHAEAWLRDDYYPLTFALLDIVRKRIRRTNRIPYGTYKEYVDRIVQPVHEDYRRFYWDLSIDIQESD